MNQTDPLKIQLPLVAVALSVVGFSLKSILIKLSYADGISSEQLILLRMSLSAPLFIAALAIALYKNTSRIKLFDMLGIFIASLLYYLSSVTDMLGLQYVGVAMERSILFTFPIFTILFSSIIYKTIPSASTIKSTVIAYLGVFLSFVSNSSHMAHSNYGLGIFLIFISAVSYAAYFVCSEKALKTQGSIKFNSFVMILSSLYAILQYVLSQGEVITKISSIEQLRFPLLLSVFSTVLPSFFMAYGIKKTSASFVSLINNAGPFLTLLFGLFVLDEQVSAFDLIGMGLVVSGIYFTKPTRRTS